MTVEALESCTFFRPMGDKYRESPKSAECITLAQAAAASH